MAAESLFNSFHITADTNKVISCGDTFLKKLLYYKIVEVTDRVCKGKIVKVTDRVCKGIRCGGQESSVWEDGV